MNRRGFLGGFALGISGLYVPKRSYFFLGGVNTAPWWDGTDLEARYTQLWHLTAANFVGKYWETLKDLEPDAISYRWRQVCNGILVPQQQQVHAPGR